MKSLEEVKLFFQDFDFKPIDIYALTNYVAKGKVKRKFILQARAEYVHVDAERKKKERERERKRRDKERDSKIVLKD